MEKEGLKNIEARTGRLFGDLWHKLDDEQFEQSVDLFASRFEANGFDLSWLEGKKCLDVGCGGGRYSIAMSRLGAGQVVGCDVSDDGLADARMRAGGLPDVSFEKASALDLPFDDGSFDFVFSSGVLHHTTDPDKGLDELTRVLRPGGKLYLLLYGSGGLRWAASGALRPMAQELGYDFMDRAVEKAGLPANNRRNFLDDFFVPIVTFVDWETLRGKLMARGFEQIERWEKGRFDHESNPDLQRKEIEKMVRIFRAAAELAEDDAKKLAGLGLATAQDFLTQTQSRITAHEKGDISEAELEQAVIGEGNHRVLAVKGGV
jgi:ubiquinone/menaquinone biosynthesis C-methylase UbiE